MRIITAAIIMAFSLMIASPAKADNPPPCDKADNECLVRSALGWKYKADALAEENKMLNQELEEERSRSDNRAFTFIAGGITFLAFFGGFVTLYKGLK